MQRGFDTTKEPQTALGSTEALYQSIVECQTEAVSRFLPDGTFLFVNAAYCRIFGKRREDLIGSRWHPVAHPDDVPVIEAQLKRMSSADPVVVIENRVYVADGRVCWMQFVNQGLYDADGRLLAIQSVGRDLTPLKTMEVHLRESEERLSMALAGAGMTSWDWDCRRRTVIARDGWRQLLGHTDPSPEEEADWEALIHPEDLPSVKAQMAAHLAGESPLFESEQRLRHSAGHWVWVESRGRVTLRDEDGHPLRVVGTLRDITMQKRLNDEGVDLLKRIEALIRDVTQASGPPTTGEPVALRDLSKRERQVLLLIARGMTSAEIGRQLHLAVPTVASHRRNLMSKLDLHSSVEITRFVHRHRLDLDPD